VENFISANNINSGCNFAKQQNCENEDCVNVPCGEIITSEEGKPSENPSRYHRRSGNNSAKKESPEKPIHVRPRKTILEIEGKETDPSVFREYLVKIVYKNAEGFDPSHLVRCSSLKILNLNGALSYFRSNAEQRSALGSLNLSLQKSGCVLRELNLSQNAVGSAILEIKPILKNIVILNLCDIGLDADTGKELFQHLNPLIRILKLSNNKLGGSIESLNEYKHLAVLDISSNKITSDGLNNFRLIIEFCTKFKEINLSDNGFFRGRKTGWVDKFL
jgi:Leucine-rich repeat (LRR) protein